MTHSLLSLVKVVCTFFLDFSFAYSCWNQYRYPTVGLVCLPVQVYII